jgi:hypothetical protein
MGQTVARAHRSRLRLTVNQFKSARLQIATLVGCLMVGAGCFATDPQKTLGVVLIAVGTGVISATIVAAIALEREDFAQTVMGLGVQDVFGDREAHFDNDFWNRMIKAARQRFDVLGVANHGYIRNAPIKQETEDAITDAVRRGVRVEILWLDPENPLADIREQEEGRRTRDEIIESIEFFWNLKHKLGSDPKGDLVLKVHTAMPTCGLNVSDDLMVVSHYLSERLNLGAPGLVLGPSMSLVDRLVELVRRGESRLPKITEVYMSNYTQISSDSTEIDQARIDRIVPLKGTFSGSSNPSEADLRQHRQEEDS